MEENTNLEIETVDNSFEKQEIDLAVEDLGSSKGLKILAIGTLAAIVGYGGYRLCKKIKEKRTNQQENAFEEEVIVCEEENAFEEQISEK